MGELRLIIDPPRAGAWNMAVDELLLGQAADEGLATLRFYLWSEPTLSLGYFQNYADRERHAASRACTVVRRPSGGGAILHDRELTYSIALPGSHPLARNAGTLYRSVHRIVVDHLQAELTTTGARLFLGDGRQTGPSAEPFLCFQRRAEGDVLLETRDGKDEDAVKVLGSAQRRLRGAVLQHGSLLLEASGHAPELPGLRDRTSHTHSLGDTIDALAVSIAQLTESPLIRVPAALVSSAKIERLASEKYGSTAWTKRR